MAFKHQMIERGMSADEIAKVTRRGAGGGKKASRCMEESVDEPVKV